MKYYTPGPSELYPTVPQHIYTGLEKGIPSMSHRSTDFQYMFRESVRSLQQLLNIPSDMHIFFMGSATEAMERLIQSCVEKKSMHLVNGAFSNRWAKVAREYGKDATIHGVPEGEGFDLLEVEVPEDAEVICVTQNETSTGVQTLVENIYTLRDNYPEKLLFVDIVSSVPYVHIDYSKLDAAFFSVQKGFGMPAGLGVLIVSERCLEKARMLQREGHSIGSYHSLLSLREKEEKYQTPETPNALSIYILGQVCQDLTRYGIQKLRYETEGRAQELYTHFSEKEGFQPFVKDEQHRSKTVIVIETRDGSDGYIDEMYARDVLIGSGYGDFKTSHVRIANFPVHVMQENIF